MRRQRDKGLKRGRALYHSTQTSRRQALANREPSVTLPPRLTILGPHWWGDGLGKVGYSLYEALKEDCSINMITTFAGKDTATIPEHLAHLRDVPLGDIRLCTPDKDIAPTVILTGMIWAPGNHDYVQSTYIDKVLKAKERIAYSMLESTQIPYEWVDQLNRYYTRVYVPSGFLVEVYKKSGVKIPIEHVPLPVFPAPGLNTPPVSGAPFTFGIIAGSWPRKNIPATIGAFQKAFPGPENVRLLIHSRFGDDPETKKIVSLAAKDQRITFTSSTVSDQQIDKWKSKINCYILASSGEGFSYTPREMLFRKVPCILSSGTAHEDLKNCPGVLMVKPGRQIPAYYHGLFGECGSFTEPDFNDLTAKIKQSYSEYNNLVKRVTQISRKDISADLEDWRNRYSGFFTRKRLLVVSHLAPGLETNNGGLNQFTRIVKSIQGQVNVCWAYFEDAKELPGSEVSMFPAVRVDRNSSQEWERLLTKESPDIILSCGWNSLHYCRETISKLRSLQKLRNTKIITYAESVNFAAADKSLSKARTNRSKEVYLNHKRTQGSELASYLMSNYVLCVSKTDQKLLSSYIDSKKLVVVPFVEEESKTKYDPNTDSKTILFLGGTWHRGNLDAMDYFMSEVFPAIKKKVPEARIQATGVAIEIEDKKALDGLARKYPLLELLGFVEDLNDLLVNCCFTVAPIVTGGGAKVKVATSWRTSTPCAMTAVAAEEIGLATDKRGSNYLDTCLELLFSKEAREREAKRGNGIFLAAHDTSCLGRVMR